MARHLSGEQAGRPGQTRTCYGHVTDTVPTSQERPRTLRTLRTAQLISPAMARSPTFRATGPPDSPDSPESTSQIEQEKLPIAHELVETELFAPTYRSYGVQTGVQCKHWKTRDLGVRAVREFLGALTDAKLKDGIFVTLAGYTPIPCKPPARCVISV